VSDGILTILKFCLLALLYLFLARVVWVVVAELRGSPAAAPGEVPDASGRRRRAWHIRVIEGGDGTDRAYDVADELTIGRGGGCGITLVDDTYASNVHARVFLRDGDLWIEDLGSTNGTLVNGESAAAAQRLHKGDRVQVGRTVLEAPR
jgi:hypothetical protein